MANTQDNRTRDSCGTVAAVAGSAVTPIQLLAVPLRKPGTAVCAEVARQLGGTGEAGLCR